MGNCTARVYEAETWLHWCLAESSLFRCAIFAFSGFDILTLFLVACIGLVISVFSGLVLLW